MNIPEILAVAAELLERIERNAPFMRLECKAAAEKLRAAVPPMDKAACRTCAGDGYWMDYDSTTRASKIKPCPNCSTEPRDEREGKPCGWRELPGGCEIYPTRSEAYLLYGDDIEPLYLRPSPAALRVAEKMEEWASWADVDYAPRLRALAKQLRGGK